jgi:hypothetical protein
MSQFDEERRGQALRRVAAAGGMGVWSVDRPAGEVQVNAAARVTRRSAC